MDRRLGPRTYRQEVVLARLGVPRDEWGSTVGDAGAQIRSESQRIQSPVERWLREFEYFIGHPMSVYDPEEAERINALLSLAPCAMT